MGVHFSYPLVETQAGTTVQRFQLGDHLGTAQWELDASGNVLSYEEYHPYGSTAWWAHSTSVSLKRYKYTGMERDEETGLQCHGVRYYAPWLGRWTSADPIGLGDGVNRFIYCGDRPTCASDTSGLASPEVERARSDFIENVSSHGQGVFTWAEVASPEAKALREAIETGVPNQPADPLGPGSLDTIGSPELLQDALANLRERSRLSREAGDPREFGAIYFVTKDGREGIVLSGAPGNASDTPMAAMYEALEAAKASMGITSDDDITVISLHSHPVHMDDTVNGNFSMLQTREQGTSFSGSLLNRTSWMHLS